jgi:hypothetical protein
VFAIAFALQEMRPLDVPRVMVPLLTMLNLEEETTAHDIAWIFKIGENRVQMALDRFVRGGGDRYVKKANRAYRLTRQGRELARAMVEEACKLANQRGLGPEA